MSCVITTPTYSSRQEFFMYEALYSFSCFSLVSMCMIKHYVHMHFWRGAMRTNIVIDNSLMRQAMKATGLSTKKAVVEEGLRLLIKVKGQEGIRRLRGKVAWEGDLDVMRESRIKAAS